MFVVATVARLSTSAVAAMASRPLSVPSVAYTAAPFTEQQVTIRMRDGVEMDAIIYTPTVPHITAASLFVHGGCFSHGNYRSQPAMAHALAGAGMVVVYSSYRQGAGHKHPSATDDLMDVTRFARARWPELPVGVVGSSSGGWHALALAESPPDNVPYAFAIGLCPVAHPGRRARYLQSCIAGTAEEDGHGNLHHTAATAASMLAAQCSYFGQSSVAGDDSAAAAATAAAMDAAGNRLLTPGPYHNKPTRTMVVLGSADKNVPLSVTADVRASTYTMRCTTLMRTHHQKWVGVGENQYIVMVLIVIVRSILYC